MTEELKRLLDAWKATGRVFYVHTRKQTVSLNGGRAKPYADVLSYLREFFNK